VDGAALVLELHAADSRQVAASTATGQRGRLLLI
jgi:hypothetical protein